MRRHSVHAIVLAVLALAGVASGGHILWNVPGTSNWNVGTNWAGSAVPGTGDTAEIGEGGGNGGTAYIDAAVSNIVNLRLGESAGQSGTLEMRPGGSLTTTLGDLLIANGGATSGGTIAMTGGDLTVNTGHLELGRDGVGTINQSGGTLTVNNSHVVMGRGADAVSTYNLSGGTLQTAGTGNVRFHMAWDNAGSNAYLNVSGTGQLITNADGISGSTGFHAAEQGTAEITVSDSGSITVNGLGDSEGGMLLGRRGNSQATLTQTGGSVTINNNYLILGRWDNAQGTYNISAGTLQTAGTTGDRNIYMGWDGAGTHGYLNVSGTGAVSTTNGALFVSGNGTATVTQTGGSVTTNNNYVKIGRSNGSVGTYDISAGTLQTAGTSGDRNIYLAWDGATSQGTLNVSGTATVAPYDNLQVAGQGTGTVNQTGGTVTLDDRYVIVGRYGTSTGEYNISGGIVQTTGNGTKTGANRRFHLGWDSADTKGTLSVSGNGQVIVNKDRVNGNTALLVGNLGTGEVNVSDNGSITVYGGGDGEGGMSLGLNGNATGTVNQTGGTVSVYDNYLMIGRRSTATGIYNISGGTLETGGLAGTNNRIYLGWDHAGATGELHVSGTGTVITNKDNLANNGGILADEWGTAEITVSDSGSITVNSGVDWEAMSLGRRGNSSGTLTQTGGSVTLNEGYLMLGRYDNSTGTYNISGGTLETDGAPGPHSSSPYARIYLGWDHAGAKGYLNISGNGSVTTNAANAADVRGGLLAGERGSAEITVSGNGSLTINSGLDGEGMSLGRHDNASATVTQTGGSVTINDGYLILGRYEDSQGTYDISGGTLKTAGTTGDRSIYLGWDHVGAKGTLNVSGSAQVIGATHLQLGSRGTGAVNQTGGDVAATEDLYAGRYDTGRGTYDISAGTLSFRNAYLGSDQVGGQGYLNVSGTAAVTGGNDVFVAGHGTGTVTQTGGTFDVNRMVMLARYADSTGTYNLNGGTLTTKSLAKGDGTASFNFGGGTLKAAASFASNVPMTINAGGANINTNGNTVTLSGALAGSGALNKIGAGTLTLAGANSYAGATNVNQGTLRVGVGVPSVAGPPAGIALWLDAADSSTMTFNGTQVSEWRDKAGGSGKVSQTDVGRLPDYVPAGINGNPVLHFTASEEDTLTNTTNYPAPTTVLYVARQTAGTKGRVLTSVTNNWLLGYHGGAVNRAYFEGWVTGGGDWQPSDDDPHMFTGVIPGSSTNSSVYADGILIASNTGGTAGPNGLSLNGWNTTSQFSDSDYAELLVYNRALTDTERMAAEAYLRGKWFPALNAIPDGSAVTIAGGAALDLNGFSETIGSLAGGGDVTLGSGTLTTGGNNAGTDFSGSISGTGGLIKDGTGTMKLMGDSDYTGPTTINNGTLQVDGSIDSDVTITGGWLKGGGEIDGSVTIGSGGGISAGASPGHLSILGIYDQSGNMLAELDGMDQGVGYDWIEVMGTATLGGTIDVDLGFAPPLGAYFDILTAAEGITNTDLSGIAFDFSDAETGFAWWATIVPLGGAAEALRLQVAPEPTTLALLALGLLPVLRRRRR